MSASNTSKINLRNDTLFSNAFHYASIGMALVAPDGKWLKVNRALCDLIGYSEEELSQLTFQEITHPDDLNQDMELLGKVLAGELETYQLEKRYFHKDGSIIHILLSVSLVSDEQGNPVHFISQIQDITERKRLEVELIRQATEDMLTGISNRRHFYELAKREIARVSRFTEPLVLLMFDIDHFKKVNDTYGHDTGDLILQKIAETAKNELRAIDILGRVGGEEFCAMLIRSDMVQGRQIAERLRKAVEKIIYPTQKGLVKPTVSIGGIAFSGSHESLEYRLKQVDDNLYKAKRGGRNRVVMSDETDSRTRDDLLFSGLIRLEWLESYESGNVTIDQQHRQLFENANGLLSAMIAGKDSGVCDELIDALISEVADHFKTEEKVLKESGYPDVKKHTALHKELTIKAKDLASKHKAGELRTADIFHFLVITMIREHIIDEDQKFFASLHQS